MCDYLRYTGESVHCRKRGVSAESMMELIERIHVEQDAYLHVLIMFKPKDARKLSGIACDSSTLALQAGRRLLSYIPMIIVKN